MPQVNVLPINVSQKIESKDAKSSFDSNTPNDDFSQYIDLHLSKNKKADNSNTADNSTSDTKENHSEIETNSVENKADTTAVSGKESNNTSDERGDETSVQNIAASGKKTQEKSNPLDKKALIESEQLMSFLTKADNTLVNQTDDYSANKLSPELLSAEQKSHYEAQLLLKTSGLVADLSPVAKAVVSDQVAQELITTSTEQLRPNKEVILGNDTKSIGKEGTEATIVKSSVDLQAAGKDSTQSALSADIDKSTNNKAVSSEQDRNLVAESIHQSKTDSKAEVKLSNINSDKTNTTQPLSSESSMESDLASNVDDESSTIAEQKLTKQTKIDFANVINDKVSQEPQQKEINQSGEIDAMSDNKAPEIKSINNNAATQINTSNLVKADSEKALQKTVEKLEKQVTQEKVSSLSESQQAKNELTQSNDAAKANEAANVKKTANVNNQLAANSDDENKVQAKQDEKAKLATSFAEQVQQKTAAQKGDEVLVADKVNGSTTRDPSTASHFIDVSGKATQTPQHIIDQQSAEMLSPSIATEVSQGQKTNTQLHQETISLFRKDFSEAVKDKVMLMISQKLQQFDITLDPPELGNMQVRVNLQGEQAAVNFLVQSQQTKDALEQNMHKLRELLAEQGVDVGDANVEQQSQQSANEEDSSDGNNSQTEGRLDNMVEANDVVAHTLSAKMSDSSTARVDYYA